MNAGGRPIRGGFLREWQQQLVRGLVRIGLRQCGHVRLPYRVGPELFLKQIGEACVCEDTLRLIPAKHRCTSTAKNMDDLNIRP